MIRFIDPTTGDEYEVAETKGTVNLAYALGYIPATGEDMDLADAVDAEVTP